MYADWSIENPMREVMTVKKVLFAGDRRSLRLREGDARCRDCRPDAVITQLDQLMPMLAGDLG